MAEEVGKVTTDPLFVGLTRPPMFLGVTYNFVMLNLIVFLLGFIMLENNKMTVFMICTAFHVLGVYICSKEPLFIELFQIQASKCPKRTNSFFHRANTYDPI
jgi:type IV secretion system protein VirB3